MIIMCHEMINFLSLRKIITNLHENHTKHINTYYETDVEFLIIK